MGAKSDEAFILAGALCQAQAILRDQEKQPLGDEVLRRLKSILNAKPVLRALRTSGYPSPKGPRPKVRGGIPVYAFKLVD